MAKHTIEFDERCKSCNGTGLYVGLEERDGAAVVCHTCKGIGCHHVKIEYDDFENKIKETDIERVFEVNPGIVIGKEKNNEYSLAEFGGMPYKDWFNGLSFPKHSENRKFTCPAWWYQSADYDKKPNWDWCSKIGSFSGCNHFGTKNRCWERWDNEYN